MKIACSGTSKGKNRKRRYFKSEQIKILRRNVFKHAQPSTMHNGAIEMDSFIGAWRLVSFEFSKDGQVSYPFGKDAVGYLMYSQDGYVAITVMSANRPNFASGDITGGSLEEKIAALDTYFSYCGRYEVRGDRVIHHLEVSLFPNWIGMDHERIFEFEDNRGCPAIAFVNKNFASFWI